MSEEMSGEASESKSLKLIITIAAYVCLAAGLILGVVALVGPLAVWLGMADFRMGFGLLQIVNSWADWVAVITFLVAVGIYFLARSKGMASGGQLVGFALAGSIAAALAWYIPETFRPPEGTPAIHDIATDPDNPLQYIAIAPLRADAANNMEYGIMEGVEEMTPQEHRRLQREAYPDIVPQHFEEPVAQVYERALEAAQSLGWEIVDADPQSARIEATDTTFWFRFKDDVVIEITAEGNDSVLNARSLSRVGRSDVGKNAARLREFFSLLQD